MIDPENFEERQRAQGVMSITPISIAAVGASTLRQIGLEQRTTDFSQEGTPPEDIWGEETGQLCRDFVEFAAEHSFLGSTVLKECDMRYPTLGFFERRSISKLARNLTKRAMTKDNPLGVESSMWESEGRTWTSSSGPDGDGRSQYSSDFSVYPPLKQRLKERGEDPNKREVRYLKQALIDEERRRQKKEHNVSLELMGYPVACLVGRGREIVDKQLLVNRLKGRQERNIYLCNDGKLWLYQASSASPGPAATLLRPLPSAEALAANNLQAASCTTLHRVKPAKRRVPWVVLGEDAMETRFVDAKLEDVLDRAKNKIVQLDAEA